jgi:hypothetical protein
MDKKVLEFGRHYERLRVPNKSANTTWTQTDEARMLRATAVACMVRSGIDLGTTSDDRNVRIVRLLKELGYLSPTTAAIDVNVQRILDDAAVVESIWNAAT